MLELAVLCISGALNILLGLVVYLKNPDSVTNRLFVLLTSSFVLWSTVSYFSIHPVLFDQVVWVRMVLFFAALLCLSVFLTFTVFPSKHLVGSRRLRRLAVLYTIFVMALTLCTPFVFGTDANGEPVARPAIIFFSILVLSLLGGGIFNLIRKYRSSVSAQKKQLRVVLWGLAGTFSLIFLTNFVLVAGFDIRTLIPLGPAYTLIFSGALGYAIVKHHLFDIRRVVARSLAYLLFVSTLIGLYTVSVLAITSVATARSSSLAQQYGPILAALLLVATGPLLKNVFDRATNKIFYRDAYDPQSFLDQLNKTLVGNIEIGILLRHTALVIEENIKAECHIYVKETETATERIMGTSQKYLKPESFKFMKSELLTIKQKTVVAESLESHYSSLREAMADNDIAVISSLITSYAANQEATAYLMLAPKKSGNAYSKQDIRIINIITDELLIAIQNALRFEEIQSFNITLQKRINDATAKLKRSNEKLKEMDETKDEFISMASHQLRTPLTSVKGYLSMVLDGDAGKVPKGQEELLNQAYISAQRMVYLIADLLNVSRLKTGKFVIDSTPVNLADMVESEISQLTEVAKGHKLSLTYSKPKDFPLLMLDETKTRQVVMNFIDNAIYYTPSGGKIKIELKTDRSSVYFMVKDNGLGVPKEDQGHLFGKFYRAKNAQKARPDGTGLGLFMAKKVITEQDGTILFESTEGKGSTFGFKFDKPKVPINRH